MLADAPRRAQAATRVIDAHALCATTGKQISNQRRKLLARALIQRRFVARRSHGDLERVPETARSHRDAGSRELKSMQKKGELGA